MRRFDPTQGPRAGLYAHFRRFAQPSFTLCAPVRVDSARLKREGGLFPNLLWAAMEAGNAVPELRQRVRVEDGREWVVEHAQLDCTCTVAREDGSFTFCSFFRDADRQRFIAQVPRSIEAATGAEGLDLSQQHRDDMLYLSSIPWRDISAVVHAASGDPLDCVPRLMWGRVEGDRLTMCVTAHHALVDGVHVARFWEAFEGFVG